MVSRPTDYYDDDILSSNFGNSIVNQKRKLNLRAKSITMGAI